MGVYKYGILEILVTHALIRLIKFYQHVYDLPSHHASYALALCFAQSIMLSDSCRLRAKGANINLSSSADKSICLFGVRLFIKLS